MHFLIWFGVIAVASIIEVLFASSGITFGAIPTIILYGAAFALCKFLTAKWDEKHAKEEDEDD